MPDTTSLLIQQLVRQHEAMTWQLERSLEELTVWTATDPKSLAIYRNMLGLERPTLPPLPDIDAPDAWL